MFLDHFINFKPAKEFHVFKIITSDFLDDMNEKLHTHHSNIYITKFIALLFTFTETCTILKGQTCN
jgi:hypothetical protein